MKFPQHSEGFRECLVGHLRFGHVRLRFRAFTSFFLLYMYKHIMLTMYKLILLCKYKLFMRKLL